MAVAARFVLSSASCSFVVIFSASLLEDVPPALLMRTDEGRVECFAEYNLDDLAASSLGSTMMRNDRYRNER